MTIVIHHSADYDGIFCREIARKFIPSATFIGWDFGDAPLKIPRGMGNDGCALYVMDLPLDRPFGFEMDGPDTKESRIAAMQLGFSNLVWIDHHKSSIESHPNDIPGYRIDGVAACRLAWHWFTRHLEVAPDRIPVLAEKQDFIDRSVVEPLAVTLAGEYDVWQHDASKGADIAFQFGLDAQQSLDWKFLLSNDPLAESRTWNIVGDGNKAMACYAKRDADVMRSRSFITSFDGLRFLCLNTARCNSNTFAALDVPTAGHDALMAFYFNGKAWSISLYHAAHRKDIDLSVIAVKYGGGGHRCACGFTFKQFPSFLATNQ
jgi:oligoribonuclease NrnB/cAMP/cGMP phosphodiesterase (DHH superfamily)